MTARKQIKTYVVVRVGVYDQGVIAVCSELQAAKEWAELAASGEEDSYHDFEIREQSEKHGEFNRTILRFGRARFERAHGLSSSAAARRYWEKRA